MKRRSSNTWPRVLIGRILYKKSYYKLHSYPYLRCLRHEEANSVMKEIHDGDCKIMSGDDLSPTRPSTRGITGPRCSTTQRNMGGSDYSVNGSLPPPTGRAKTSTLSGAPGLSCGGGSIWWVLFYELFYSSDSSW